MYKISRSSLVIIIFYIFCALCVICAICGVATESRLFRGGSLSAQTAESDSFDIAPGTPAQLMFTVQPSNTTVNNGFAPSVQVTVQDAYGNTVVTATNTITITGTGLAFGGANPRNAINGVATFSDLTVGGISATGYTLTATSAGLTSATSTSFAITGFGSAAQLLWVQAPTSPQTQNQNWTPSPSIRATDVYSNTVTTYSSDITIERVSGTGALSNNSISAVSGIATFSSLQYDTVEVITIRGVSGALTPTNNVDITIQSSAIPGSWTATVFTTGAFANTITTTGAADVTLSLISATFTETFSSTTYRDGATTANWNTASGTVTLPTTSQRPLDLETGSSNYTGARCLGYRFTPTANGFITALGRYRYNSSSENTSICLWDDTGNLLGNVTVSGWDWQYANLATPVPVTAGNYYRVAVTCAAQGQTKAFTYPATRGNIQMTNSCAVFGTDIFPTTLGTTSLYGFADVEFTTYQSPRIAQSTKVNTSNFIITRATLTATQTLNGGSVVYEMTANGGVNWEAVTSGGEYTFANTGTDLRWRATLSTSDLTQTPSIDQISITYYPAYYFNSGIAETFLTTTNRDAPNTTANWNTSDGTLVLAGGYDGSQRPVYSIGLATYAGTSNQTIGYRFRPNVNGRIVALGRFDGVLGNTTVSLWTNAGSLLASVTVPDAPGFQWATLAIPVNVTAGTDYVVGAYYSTSRRYGNITLPTTVGDIQIMDGRYIGGNAFPTSEDTTYLGLADIEFQPGPAYSLSGVGQSIQVNIPPIWTITRAILTATQTLNGGSVAYEMTANGGTNWYSVTTGVEFTFPVSGTDLRWRATLSTPSASQTPSIDQIIVIYRYSITGAYLSAGISPPSGTLSQWNVLTFTRTAPGSTTFTVDVLNEAGTVVLLTNVGSGGSLSSLNPVTYPIIRLRANFGTTDTTVTPTLSDWLVSYTYVP